MFLAINNLSPIIAYSDNISGSITYNGMSFEIKDESPYELILTEYTGNDETLVIPKHIGDYTVTAIDNAVFKDNQKIRNITLPDSINYFGSEVFRNSSLVYINIPKSLRIIPKYSFNNCSELETVVFHDDILLLDYTAFKKTDIKVPSELKETIFNGIETSNTSHSFQGDEWDYTLTNENGCLWICLDKYNSTDTEVIVPDNINGVVVTEIDRQAFKDAKFIRKIYFPKTITDLTVYFIGSKLEEVTLPDINRIPDYMFMGCTNLKTINFQSNPESFIIGDYAFMDCNINFVPYPESCNNIIIGKYAFENTLIKELVIDFNSSISTNAFFSCSDLSYVKLKNTHIGTDTFKNCSKLSYVELSNTYLDSWAFRNCSALETVTINGSSSLEEASFYDCQALENINVVDLSIPMANSIDNCQNFMSINNQNVFDNTTGDFNKDLKEFVFRNFYGVDEVGFINLYVKAQAEKIVKEITFDNMDDIQKVKAIHDWVCNNTVYDDGLSGDRKNHNDASVLMNDSTVCEGYARISNILYNTAGIESYYISGVGHAWNIVKVGNNYFHVDTTWDDGDKISYDWFMKSDDEMRNSDEYHASWKTYIPSSLHSFQQGKILPECSYSMGDINQDKSINVADLVILNKIILGISTGIDYVLADLTFDGIVDSFDLIKMRQLIINHKSNNI